MPPIKIRVVGLPPEGDGRHDEDNPATDHTFSTLLAALHMMKRLFHPVVLRRLFFAGILAAGALCWAQPARDNRAQPAAARPAMIPGPGDYKTPQQVTLKCATPGAILRYSLDGITPARPDAGLPYTAPIAIDKNTTLVAAAFKQGLAESPPAFGTYWIGPPAKAAVNSFHVGNSLTGNTGQFPMYARTAGRLHRYQSYLRGGALTVQLWNAKDTIDQARWQEILGKVSLPLDHFTVQPRDFNIEQEAGAAVKFFNLVREKSPGVQPWLYAEWVEKSRSRPSDKGLVPSSQMKKLWPALTWEESMGAMLLYCEEVQRKIAAIDHAGKHARILPVSLAMGWARNLIDRGKLPGVSPGEAGFYATLFADQVHVNANGSYLVDMTWYAAFYRESPEGKVLPAGTTLTAEQAAVLQRLAWDVVENYPDCGLYAEGASPCGKPEFSAGSPSPGGVTTVHLDSSTPGAWFRYTLDGTVPTRTRGYVYCGVVSLRPGMTLTAVAFKSGMADSPVAEFSAPAK